MELSIATAEVEKAQQRLFSLEQEKEALKAQARHSCPFCFGQIVCCQVVLQ